MIVITDLTYHLGKRTLYDKASLHVKPKDKIGLIGENGAGKSTLLHLITGSLKADGGQISLRRGSSIGFLDQNLLSYQSEESILHVAMQAFDEVFKIQKKIESIYQEMQTNYSDDLLKTLSALQKDFDSIGGYDIQAKSEEMLEGLGFATKDLNKPLNTFSGGWRMRVMFAKLLLQQPSLLILDEPTNHLDLVSIKWVESYLKSSNNTIIIVSHDKSFLDGITTKIVEIENKKFQTYTGNYSAYEQHKAEKIAFAQSAYANQQKQIKHAQEFIDRFRAKASKAKLVQSRIKALERIEKIESSTTKKKTVNFNFSIDHNPSKIVARLENITKSYADYQIFKNAKVQIDRGDKIALVGANGRGKTTLLRIIAGHESVDQQRRTLGSNVQLAFYAQHQLDVLDLNHTILEELQKSAGEQEQNIQYLRTIASMFLFTKDDVFKQIKVLSGGEKARVALAKLLISKANLLLLDEPTNHLDIQSIAKLGQALQQYEGTFVCISHDRNFIRQIANKIWYIENQNIKVFHGNFDEFEHSGIVLA